MATTSFVYSRAWTLAVGRQQFTMYTLPTFFTSLAYQWFTCLLTLVYENTTCFGVSSYRLLSLGEGGGLLHLVCPQPAGWLSRLGLYIPGCLQPVGPCVQCDLVWSGVHVWADCKGIVSMTPKNSQN